VTAAAASPASEKRVTDPAASVATSRLTVIVMTSPHDSTSTRRMHTAARAARLGMANRMYRVCHRAVT
jgi:hypothetical protein